MACFVCLEQLPARPLIFSFGPGVMFGPGRGRQEAVSSRRAMSCGLFCVPEQLPARPLIFSFGSGVTFGPGRGTAGGCFVTPCQGVFLISKISSCCLFYVPGTIACQILDFFIRFRSDVWPGQRDSRRLFRHAVPGCFPDLKGVLWLVLCAWNNCLPDP